MHIISLVCPAGTLPSKIVVMLSPKGCPANPTLASAVPPVTTHSDSMSRCCSVIKLI